MYVLGVEWLDRFYGKSSIVIPFFSGSDSSVVPLDKKIGSHKMDK